MSGDVTPIDAVRAGLAHIRGQRVHALARTIKRGQGQSCNPAELAMSGWPCTARRRARACALLHCSCLGLCNSRIGGGTAGGRQIVSVSQARTVHRWPGGAERERHERRTRPCGVAGRRLMAMGAVAWPAKDPTSRPDTTARLCTQLRLCS